MLASASRLARLLRERERRFTVLHHAETLLQLRSATVHEARPDHWMPLKLFSQGFQKGVALLGVYRRGCRLNGDVFGVGKAQRHWRVSRPGFGGRGRRDSGRRGRSHRSVPCVPAQSANPRRHKVRARL